MNSSGYLNLLHSTYRKPLEEINHILIKSLEEDFPSPQFLYGGKRLRPLAVLISGKAYENYSEKLLKAALSVELIHATSLVHDDIIDEDAIRRNFPTLYSVFGKVIAVLSGDYLFVKALEMIYQTENRRVFREMLDAANRMVKGELDEEVLPEEKRLQEEVYMDIINKKTASLFEFSFVAGGIMRKEDEKTITILRKAGSHYGMAYQIADDCDDLMEEVEKGKITLPLIKVYDPAIRKLFDSPHALMEEVIRRGGMEMAVEEGLKYLDLSMDILSFDPELQRAFEPYHSYLRARMRERLQKANA